MCHPLFFASQQMQGQQCFLSDIKSLAHLISAMMSAPSVSNALAHALTVCSISTAHYTATLSVHSSAKKFILRFPLEVESGWEAQQTLAATRSTHVKTAVYLRFVIYLLIQQICSRVVFNQIYIFEMQEVVMTNDEVKKAWTAMSKIYDNFDSAPQTHFFTLVSLLKLRQAQRILEIGCGTGRLLPYALSQKGQNTKYYATDFIDNLLDITKKRLERDLQRYQSKLSFQEWCNKQKLTLEQHDVQKIYDKGQKFDRIICNLVLMLVNNAENALQKLHAVASDDCLLGLTIWGDKNKTPFMRQQERILEQKSGIKRRSNFHLFGKIQQILEKTGWQIVLNFEQNSIFPFTSLDPNNKFFFGRFEGLPEQKKKEGIEQLSKIVENLIYKEKVGINFSNQVIVARKKK